MKVHFRLIFVALFALLTSLAFGDPPSRVARLSFIGGQVAVQPGGVDEWAEAVLNRPLTTADRVWADTGSRAELQLGGATVRIDSETSLGLTNIGDDVVQLALDHGFLNVHVDRLEQDEAYEVDTPNVAFSMGARHGCDD